MKPSNFVAVRGRETRAQQTVRGRETRAQQTVRGRETRAQQGAQQRPSACRFIAAPSTLATAVLLAAVAMTAASGCHRAYYRRQADAEVYSLVHEKSAHPHWALEGYTIDVDPRSRMFNPFAPDREPMPLDDPTAHKLMHHVDGKRGYPYWHANGETPFADNPMWLNHLPLDENGILQLDSDLAVELALIHSPDYQRQLETLYLSALDVSAERFRFDPQWFAGYAATYTHDARARRAGLPGLETGGDSRSVLDITTFSSRAGAFPGATNVGVQRAFTTGAEFAAAFANTFVWQFSGTNTLEMAYTPLAFSLFQPLLRQAGRDVIMETLTLSERTLLANVRQMERFRRGFHMDVMTGAGNIRGPQRRGGVFGASGLAGFTGVGTGFGALGGAGVGAVAGVGPGAVSAGGFLGLLQDQMVMGNQEDNVLRLRDNLLRLEETMVEMLTTIPETQEDIPRQRLQVAQARQALFNAEAVLLNSRAAYQNTLDAFKLTLGLPPTLCVEIRDPMLEQFNLFDPPIKERRMEVDQLRERVGGLNIEILNTAELVEDPATGVAMQTMPWTAELERRLQALRQQLDEVEAIVERLETVNAARVKSDIDALAASMPRREQEAERLQTRLDESVDDICALLPEVRFEPAVLDVRALRDLPVELGNSARSLEQRFAQYREHAILVQESIDEILDAGADPTMPLSDRDVFLRIRDEVVLGSQGVLTALGEDVLAYQLIQARARTEGIMLVPVELSDGEALELARNYRRDWMNARANLVDRWRLIEFNADALESSLDVVFNGDISNVGNNPFDIRSSTGRLQVGFRFDAPFTRLLERNIYRQALIEYQQERRGYYQFVDNTSSNLRAILRTLERNQFNFELQRYAVRIAAEQIDLNEDIRLIREAAGQSSGPTAARDTVSALSDLLSAQNNFLAVWVNYEVLRRRLDLDLGTMQLDERGRWIDPGPIGGRYGLPMPLGGECLPGELIPEGAIPLEDAEELDDARELEIIPPGRGFVSPLAPPEQNQPRRRELFAPGSDDPTDPPPVPFAPTVPRSSPPASGELLQPTVAAPALILAPAHPADSKKSAKAPPAHSEPPLLRSAQSDRPLVPAAPGGSAPATPPGSGLLRNIVPSAGFHSQGRSPQTADAGR